MAEKINFKEFLGTIDEEQIVAIGPKNGNSFVYIGKAGNTELIEKCFEDVRCNTIERVDYAKTNLESLVLNPPVIKDQEEKDDIIRSRAALISSKLRIIESGERYLKGYIPAFKRNVEENYVRDCPGCENELVILVGGTENGRFWFRSEFEKVYK